MVQLDELNELLKCAADKERAQIAQSFFKTGKGEYGEGDVFLGLSAQQVRRISKRFQSLPLDAIKILLTSEIHEKRSIALLILAEQYRYAHKAADIGTCKALVEFYLSNTHRINSWDLVDASAPHLLGWYLLDRRAGAGRLLARLAKSDSLWERRISIIATLAFIRANRFGETLRIAELLLQDPHDLIHKAVGWMLREVGKRDEAVEEHFLRKHVKIMPRTMLRYAIERFAENKRRYYLQL
jgi:3-methyladenine DNA glycosylase AlkD